MNPSIDISRIAPPSVASFDSDFVRASRPVVLRGAIDDWPAMKKWSLDYFRRVFGDRQLPVVREKDRSQYDARSGLHYERIRFGDYCDLIADGKPHTQYMVVRVHELIPELFADIRQPVYSAGRAVDPLEILAGCGGHQGPAAPRSGRKPVRPDRRA